jgi:Zn-dependent M28 family amino/carboxypeptidase
MKLLAALAVGVLLQPGPAAAPDSLLRDVTALAADGSHDARFDALTALLKARNLPFEVEPFTLDKPAPGEPRTTGRNVVVSLGAGEDHLVVGAHYDAVRLKEGSFARGAVDNAASSVMLVHLAGALAGAKLTKRVHIVWFDLEEIGLRGAAAYATRHAARKTSAMINFDINAYGNTMLFGPSERPENAALKRTLLTACANEAVNCVAFPQMPPGDDRVFTQRGIPTLSLATLPAAELHQLWLMMNAGPGSGLAKDTIPGIIRTIHTPDDTLDKVDGKSVAQALRLATALVRVLAE